STRRPKPRSGDLGELGQRPAQPGDRLADPLLVLDEREANVAVAARSEARPRADRDASLTRELDGELERAELAVGLGNLRPDEHGPPRLRDRPADPCEAVAERVPARAIRLADLQRVVGRLVHRHDRGDLDRLEGAVVEVGLEPGEPLDDPGVAEDAAHPPPRPP